MPIYASSELQKLSGTGVGTNAGVTVTLTGIAGSPSVGIQGKRLSPLGIQVSGDAACVVTIESPASTVLWRKRFAAAFTGSESFTPGAIVGSVGGNLLVKISASTANCEANIQAAEVPR